MFKKIVRIILFVLLLFNFENICIYAYSTNHILPKDWYREDIANLSRDKVTSITIENKNVDKSNLKTYWDINRKGLIAYIDDTDVYIACPENDTISTDYDASDIFSFFILKEFKDYETGDDNALIYGVKPKGDTFEENTNSIYISSVEAIYNLYLLDVSKTNKFDGFFKGLSKIEELDLSNFQTKSATSFIGMFEGCEMLNNIDLEYFDTKNVYDMSNMFKDCKMLDSIDTKNFKTSQLNSMSGMFFGCERLKTINLNHFDTRFVRDMSSMFMGCTNIENIYIDKFDTKKVRQAQSMFRDCSKIKKIDIDKLDFSGIIDCRFMFLNCKNLESVNLSSFKLVGEVYCHYMLSECKNLKKVEISDFIAERINEIKFSGKWENLGNSVVYDFDVLPIKKLPNEGVYVKYNSMLYSHNNDIK